MKKATVIVIAFTLKGQSLDEIRPLLKEIKKEYPKAELVHGFMTRKAVEHKKYDTALVDTLDSIFPRQRTFYNEVTGSTDRVSMKNYAYDQGAEVFVIGDIKEGVREEVILYLNAGIQPVFLTLGKGMQGIDAQIIDKQDGRKRKLKASGEAWDDADFEVAAKENETANLVAFGSWIITNEQDYTTRPKENTLTEADVEQWRVSLTKK